jgi:N-acetylglucosaminyldiphosphoundecaprenol N-acetyl-beta-D-mannosaminyltransferase
MGVGYAFDVIAGNIRECPSWMTRAGIEWLYRLAKEPRRLWQRYLVRDPYYFFLILKQRLAGTSTSLPPGAANRD